MTEYDALPFETAGEVGGKSRRHPHSPDRAHEGEVRHMRHASLARRQVGGPMTTPDRLIVAVTDAARSGRAMPLAPADMALARPDLWPTAKAAERHLEVRGGDKGFGGF